MRSHQKVVLYRKMNDFSRLCPLQTTAWQSGIPEFRILEFWNSGILEFPKWTILKAEVGTRKRPSNWPFPENRGPRIPEFRILEFWNSGILELPKWTILKAEVGTRKRPSN